MENERLTGQIIAAAIQVQKSLGLGFLESIYEEAMCLELDHLDIKYERQKPISIFHRDKCIGQHRLDMLVEDIIVLELKAVKSLDDVHFVIVRSYLKAVGLRNALLINFATMPLTVKRIGCEFTGQKKSDYLAETRAEYVV